MKTARTLSHLVHAARKRIAPDKRSGRQRAHTHAGKDTLQDWLEAHATFAPAVDRKAQ